MRTVSKPKTASPEAIISFFKRRKLGSVFTLDRLNAHVMSKNSSLSPATVSRSLRNLREQDVLDYKCVDSKAGKYEITGVPW